MAKSTPTTAAMTDLYNPAEIEPKWQERWEADGLYHSDIDPRRPKFYALTMLPYPSGDLHIGHWYAMTPSDARARFMRMQGYNVMFPIGFDAFGLPAENAAIKRNIHPKAVDLRNIDNMRRQLRTHGRHVRLAAGSWSPATRNTTAGRSGSSSSSSSTAWPTARWPPVDWCPNCNTTLAREQVWGDDRHCERCGTPVIKKNLEQWFFRITEYADELLDFSSDRLAGAGAHAADQLDRPQSEGAWCHLHDRAGGCRWRSSPPARTRCGARPSWCWRPSIRWWTS